MNKAISVRHNKDYTSVLINKLNRKNMLIANATAIKVSREEHREAVVIKPTKKALMEYRETSHEQELMENTPIGHSFTLLGVAFTVVDRPDPSEGRGEVTLKYKQPYKPAYYTSNKQWKIDCVFGMFYFQSLIENVYKVITNGDLMYFQQPKKPLI